MPKNYYIILGIPSESTSAEIKTAYRRLAKELHPDHYGENQVPFQVLQEAYSVLSDPKSRREHDALLKDSAVKRSPQQDPGARYYEETIEPLSPYADPQSVDGNLFGAAESLYGSRSIFDGIFEQFLGHVTEHRRTHKSQPENVKVEITLSPEQALRGGSIRLNVPLWLPCPLCLGRGGTGFFRCRQCNGRGLISQEQRVQLHYPAKIMDNQSLQFILHSYDFGKILLTAIFRIRSREL